MSTFVSSTSVLADIYPSNALPQQVPRWNSLLQAFHSAYGHHASFVARSPGRVNIIGEHIDYSLYSVLPMAITADALLAVSSKPDVSADSFKISIRNVLGNKFPAGEITITQGCEVDIDSTKFDWTNYFKSGLKGALQLLRKKKGDVKLRDMEIMMDGSVPVGGGLSSSAAFTTASALAVMVANGASPVDKNELTELAIVSERAVGVNSGGMDQSASVFSEQGSALFVSFSPRLQARPVLFPPTAPDLCFVIAQSFVTSNKHVTGPIHYNLRVVECSIAAAYLNAVLNPPGTTLPVDAGPLGISLRGFQNTYFYHHSGKKAAPKALVNEHELEKLVQLVKQTLTQEEGYTREQIAKTLGLSVKELEQRFTSRFPVHVDRFKLRQRALHVFEEALRVLSFFTLLESPPHTGSSHTTSYNAQLGNLMNATQESCRVLYECSCKELDKICKVAREAGAYGSRLTGAGWGGCSVHLVPADKVCDVTFALEKEYYSQMELTKEQRENAVVVSQPGHGSAVYVVVDGKAA